jgi:hypothetical protein
MLYVSSDFNRSMNLEAEISVECDNETMQYFM